MIIFKAFFKILKKNLTGIALYVVIYLAITVFVSVTSTERADEVFSKEAMDIGLENRDQGRLGAALAGYLGQSNAVKKIPESREELCDAMYYREIDYVLKIPEDFTERFGAGEREGLIEGTDVPGSAASFFVEHEVDGFLKTVGMYLDAGIGMERALQLAEEDMGVRADVSFLSRDDARQMPVGYYYFQYLPYVFISIMVLGVGAAMMSFQDRDMDGRNKCASMPFFSRNLQIFLGCAAFTAAVDAVFLGMACGSCAEYLFSAKGALSAVNAVIFSICALSLAWFLSGFLKNQETIVGFSNLAGLSFSFLGGVFVPMDVMGETARQIARFVPSYWYEKANGEIQKAGGLADAGQIWLDFLAVAMFALAFFSMGLLARRMKLMRAQ